MPRVSVIVPTYNRAATVVRAVESVFSQTYHDYELLVVDDGSTDSTADELAPLLDRLHYIRQKNAGASAARNTGLAHAQGELIAFLDSDDVWRPRKLDRQVGWLDDHPHCDFVACLGEGDRPLPRHDLLPTAEQQFLAFLRDPFPSNMTRYIVRRSCVERFGTFDCTLQGPEDWEFWLRLLRGGCRFGLVPEPLVRYYFSDDAISLNTARMLAGEAKIAERYVATLVDPRLRNRVARAFEARRQFSAALSYEERGRLAECRSAVWKSLRASLHGPRTWSRLRCLLTVSARMLREPRATTGPLAVSGPTP